MEKTSRDIGKIRRQSVKVELRDGSVAVHPICDLAIPSPDGRYFVLRDLTAYKETPGKKGESLDVFYPSDLIKKIEITSKQYLLLSSGERGEEVLDIEEKIGQIIT